jgi:hypothetical protein
LWLCNLHLSGQKTYFNCLNDKEFNCEIHTIIYVQRLRSNTFKSTFPHFKRYVPNLNTKKKKMFLIFVWLKKNVPNFFFSSKLYLRVFGQKNYIYGLYLYQMFSQNELLCHKPLKINLSTSELYLSKVTNLISTMHNQLSDKLIGFFAC